jgi:hypothetical protein
MTDYQPLLTNDQMIALAHSLEEGDVTAFVLTAEVAARNYAFIAGALDGRFTVRQDGGEWVFLRDGREVGRIVDVAARPSGTSA